MQVSFQNKEETDFLYEEIFVHESYARHGITIEQNACVLDVGANIGLFALYVGLRAPQAAVYAFEPIPAVFKNLQINTALYQPAAKVFNFGLSKEQGTATFTWFRHNSLISGRYADAVADHSTVKIFLQNRMLEEEVPETAIDELLAERLEGSDVTCEIRSLSSVIAHEQIRRVDLLKIDVEKSELDVLQGIAAHDWEKIHQIVVEVHDIEGRVACITQLLQEHGYDLEIEQDESLKNTNLYNIYARRRDALSKAGASLATVCGSAETTKFFNAGQLIAELRARLALRLPEYMVPAAYVMLEELPMTGNGKLDRKGLPAPEDEAYGRRGYEEPVGELEWTVSGIWAELLKVKRVGRQDNFFELGGHSLLAIRVIRRLQAAGLQVNVGALFATSTLMELAASLKRKVAEVKVPENLIPEGCEEIRPEMLPLVQLTKEQIERIVGKIPGGAGNVQDIYPLAPLQEGILFHHLMGGRGDAYLLGLQLSFDSRSRMES
jgi:FkbM family methyltransferase